MGSLSFFLSSPVALKPTLNYVHSTGQFKTLFGKDKDNRIGTNLQCNGELRTASERLKLSVRKAVTSNCKQSLYCTRTLI